MDHDEETLWIIHRAVSKACRRAIDDLFAREPGLLGRVRQMEVSSNAWPPLGAYRLRGNGLRIDPESKQPIALTLCMEIRVVEESFLIRQG